MRWISLFKFWVVTVTLSLILIPVNPIASVYIAVLQFSLLFILSTLDESMNNREKSKVETYAILPGILISAIFGVFPAVRTLPLAIITGLGYATGTCCLADSIRADKPLKILATTSSGIEQVIIYFKASEVLSPSVNDILITAAAIIIAFVLQNFLAVKIVTDEKDDDIISIGNPLKGRIYSRMGNVPWKDKWPRFADVKWGNIERSDISRAYRTHRRWCPTWDFCSITQKISLKYPIIKDGRMTFYTVLLRYFYNGVVVKITQRSPDISWIATKEEPPAGTEIKKIFDIKGFKIKWVSATGEEIAIGGEDGTVIKYKDGEDHVTVKLPNDEKTEIPLSDWQELGWEDIEVLLKF